MKRYFLLCTVLALSWPNASSQAAAPAKFCLLPVDESALTESPRRNIRLLNFDTQIPYMSSPLFESAGDRYWIDQNLKLEKFPRPYPVSGVLVPTSWVKETWNSRVLGIDGGSPPTVLELREGETKFHILFQDRPIVDPNLPSWANLYRFNFIGSLPDRHQTIVGRFDTREAFLVGQNSLSPWISPDELFQNDVNGISALFYSKSLSATVVVDNNYELHIHTDKGAWYNLGDIGDQNSSLFDVPGIGAVIEGPLFGPRLIIHESPAGSPSPFYLERPTPPGWFSAWEWIHVSHMFGQVLRYRNGIPLIDPAHWQVLTPNGYVDIPGGATGQNPGYNFPKDLTAIHKSLIQGWNEWFLYDGKVIRPIIGTSIAQMGIDLYNDDMNGESVHDLPSIDRVLAVRPTGIFEITADGRIIKQAFPFFKGDDSENGMDRDNVARDIQFHDWPEAGVAVADTGGLFIVDRNLHVSQVDTGAVEIGDSLGTDNAMENGMFLPLQAPILLTGNGKLFVLVDTALAGPAACPKRDQ